MGPENAHHTNNMFHFTFSNTSYDPKETLLYSEETKTRIEAFDNQAIMALREMVIDECDDIESYSEPTLCLDKAKELLALINLPTGLLPLKDMTEVGYNKTKGFVWMRMRSKIEHTFPAIGRKVIYDTEITAFVEDRRMRRLTGVKSKELMIWVPVNDIFIKEKDPEKITFANTTGLSRTFKVSAFQSED